MRQRPRPFITTPAFVEKVIFVLREGPELLGNLAPALDRSWYWVAAKRKTS